MQKSPNYITKLQPDEIFVFGSNLAGMHGGGAARLDEFIKFAKQHPQLKFLVTEIGCGIAGFSPSEIAPLFEQAREVKNIYLPERFWMVLK